MAKRFTSTDIWQEDWFLELSKEYMLAWFYIKDNCNHAGIWRPNKRQLEFITNSKIDLNEFLSLLNSEKERVVVLEDGKWYLADFISFQYGNILNENNRVHASIVKELIASKIDTCNFEVKERSIRPQDNPNQGVKDKDKDKDKELVKDIAKDSIIKEPLSNFKIDYSFAANGYIELWERWLSYKLVTHKFKYKSNESEQLAFNKFVKDSHNYLPYATEVLDTTIASGKWEGITFTKELVEKWKSKIPNRAELPEIFSNVKALKSAAVGENYNWAKKVAKNNEEHTAILIDILAKEGVVLNNEKFEAIG